MITGAAESYIAKKNMNTILQPSGQYKAYFTDSKVLLKSSFSTKQVFDNAN